MFQVGDKIVYPRHGAGVIQAIEEKEVLEKNRLYYILSMPQTRMQIMVPLDEAENLGIRSVVEPEVLEKVLSNFHQGQTDPNIYADQRYCRDLNRKKIKTGDIYQETEIIRDLVRKSHKNKLGAEDANMLNSARQMFISELMQVKGIAQEQATDLLDTVLAACS
ncbi:MAG TPA: CarD family transcriptional regulator [Desulfobacteria bacterium]|nr:CarD family transcriptional regulator [Desulfobacteria bacterium]